MSYRIDYFLRTHPRIDAVLTKLLPRWRFWIDARAEWSVGRTFNDGPDEYYWPWKKYWASVKEISRYGHARSNPHC